MAEILLSGSRAPVEAFGFDVDGVLRDTGYQAFLNCRLAIAELGGMPPEFEDFVHDWKGLLFEYYRSCGVHAPEEVIHRVNQERIAEHDLVFPFEDVADALLHLQSLGIELFALSGHASEKINAWFLEHNLHPHFAYIQGDGREKVAHLSRICAEISVTPSAACYVGDWAQDMRAAKEVGLIPIGLTREHPTHSVLLRNGAALVIDHLSELTALVS